jgi:hypothetical protein
LVTRRIFSLKAHEIKPVLAPPEMVSNFLGCLGKEKKI